jgi:predicted nucleic acid-binding protein
MIIGVTSDVLCYALDTAYPEHRRCAPLLQRLRRNYRIAVSPTTVVETYRTLVRSQKWKPMEARRRLGLLLQHPYAVFLNETERVCSTALALASRHNIGSRNSLVIAGLISNKVPTLLTTDDELCSLAKIEWRGSTLAIRSPLRRSALRSTSN